MKKHILRTFTLALVACFLLALSSCTKESKSLLDLQNYTYSDGEFEFVRWAGYTWAVIPLDEITEQYRFDIMLVDAEEADIQKIESRILSDYELIYTKSNLPTFYPSCMNVEVFMSDDYQNATIQDAIWCMDSTYNYTIRMYTILTDRGLPSPPTAIISIINQDNLMDYCMELENEE